jgi:hypothetical protein
MAAWNHRDVGNEVVTTYHPVESDPMSKRTDGREEI